MKCDEQKPECGRCISTGRTCERYLDNTERSCRFLSLVHCPSTAGLNATQVDGRALQFFRTVVQPALTGPVDAYFWDSLVLQFSQYHPAVRHAIIAISTLYEDLHQEKSDAASGARELAVQHYSSAIRGIVEADSESVALVACILFICIEYMRGNAMAATQHCRHGIIILNRCAGRYPWIACYLLPIFRRLSIMPLFHGSWLRSMPSLAVPQIEIESSSCSTFTKAQHLFDQIQCRAIQCIRSGDAHRMGFLPPDSITPEMYAEQKAIALMICQWQESFLCNNPTAQQAPKVRLLAQCLVGQIWVEMAFEPDERKFSRHTDAFKQVVDLASSIERSGYSHNSSQEGVCAHPAKFVFEIGFTPLLYFVTIKCRQLNLRLAALSLLQKLGVSHESLWNLDAMVYMARRIVEEEHGIDLATISANSQGPLLDDDAYAPLEAGPIFVYDVKWQDTTQNVHAYRADQITLPKLQFIAQDHELGCGLTVLDDCRHGPKARCSPEDIIAKEVLYVPV